jgi:UDP-N-acetyl-D-glucosamine dehydrogenase
MSSLIAIVGLGYVGLPLAVQFARSGVHVIGLDVDEDKIDKLNRGESYIGSISNDLITEINNKRTFESCADFKRVCEVEAVIICVPTPLTRNREPDISYILNTGEQIAPHLRHGSLVVLESTSYPGTTDEDLRVVLEQHSGLKAGVDFHLAFSPEREDPGNPKSKVGDIPKVVGGLTNACRDRALELYSRAIKHVVPMSSCRAAEATKLLENIFRSVNIALVNELKVIYAVMGIDIWEVIEAAKTKPFGFMPFYPGPGLGGHCIPIDPFYLTWKAREFGKHTRFIELAGEINTAMPEYVVNRIAEALNAKQKPVSGSRVLLIGLAYKPNVDDMRESATFALMDLLKARGGEVEYYDPHISTIKPTREHDVWTGKQSIEWNEEALRAFDVVLIATAHSAIDYDEVAAWCDCIIDTRNAMQGVPTKPGQVWKA